MPEISGRVLAVIMQPSLLYTGLLYSLQGRTSRIHSGAKYHRHLNILCSKLDNSTPPSNIDILFVPFFN